MTSEETRRAGRKPMPEAVVLVPVVLLPLLLLAYKMRSAVSLSPDSLLYLHAAKSLAAGEGLVSLYGPAGTQLTLFPPLYPALLALVGTVTPSLTMAAALLGMAGLALACALTFLLVRGEGLRTGAAAALTLAVFLNSGPQMVFSYVWSEVPYIVLVLILLFLFARLPRLGPLGFGIVLGLFVGAAFLTRYIGVTLLPAVLLGIAALDRFPLERRIVCALSATATAALVVAAMVLRNVLADGTAFGGRTPTDDTLLFAVGRLLTAFGQFLLPFESIGLVWGALGFVGLAALVLLLARYGRLGRADAVTITAAAIVVLHLAMLVYSQITTAIDPINIRLLSPVFAPLAVLAARGLAHWWRTADGTRVGAIAPYAAAAYLLVVTGQAIAAANLGAGGFTLTYPTPPAVPQACRSGERPTFTNWPGYLRFLGLVADAKPLPRETAYRQAEQADDWGDFLATVERGGACLIWAASVRDAMPPKEALLGGPAEDVAFDIVWQEPGMAVAVLRPAR